MTPLLIGTDGSQKMSKSLGNYIGVAEPPNEIYGKVMSIPDSLILDYFELLTDVPDHELDEFRQSLAAETVNPMRLKKRLARELITQLYDQKAATEAEEHFARVVQKKEVPEEIRECPISFDRFREFLMQMGQAQEATLGFPTTTNKRSAVNVNRLLVEIGLAKSHSEAGRLIAQGAVEIDGEKVTSNVVAPVKDIFIIKVGKRRFARVINTDRIAN
jgi:tyrosyl-tRNA synthetase